MIDLGIQKGVGSGALAYSYAYSDIIKKAKTHSNDNLDDADAIAKLRPSLILVNSSTYNSYSQACDNLGTLYPLAVIDTMSDIEATGFRDHSNGHCLGFSPGSLFTACRRHLRAAFIFNSDTLIIPRCHGNVNAGPQIHFGTEK